MKKLLAFTVVLIGLSASAWAGGQCDSAADTLNNALDDESHFCEPSRPDGGNNSVCDFTRAVRLPHAWRNFLEHCLIREDQPAS